jgi:hypothetical protein
MIINREDCPYSPFKPRQPKRFVGGRKRKKDARYSKHLFVETRTPEARRMKLLGEEDERRQETID